jgi:hypothetical protein
MLVHNRHSSRCITSTQPVPESFTPSRFHASPTCPPLFRAIRAATSSSHLGGCRCLLSILRIVSILLPVVDSAGQASGSNLESSPNHRLPFINLYSSWTYSIKPLPPLLAAPSRSKRRLGHLVQRPRISLFTSIQAPGIQSPCSAFMVDMASTR